MDRGDDATGRGWSVVFSPSTGNGAKREYRITDRQMRLWKRGTFGLLAVLGVLLVVLAVTLPRSWRYSALIDENLALKGRVQEVDRRMSEVDRILLRLRMYDAQLRSLYQPDGDHGPLPERQGNDDPGHGGESMDPWEDLAEDREFPVGSSGVNTWADSVLTRVDGFVSLFERAEPNLSHLVEELEDLRALELALPNEWPTEGKLSSGYGYRRSPIARSTQFHKGVDIANKAGTEIRATAAGTVVKAGWSGGYGRMIELDHGFGITTRYAHCSRLRVKVGDYVERGMRIATMGSTGRVTGPHLHFEVRIDGHAVDPQDYLPE